MTPEFNLIQHYFTRTPKHTDLGVGDDAALIRVESGHQLAVSADTSVVGTHFFADCAPYTIGWKSLAVNVSDMAAMGATPQWTTLAIALPAIEKPWLAEFSRGFFACADAFGIDLIGGDTTRGPLNISITIMGQVPIGQALQRSGAQAGDDIWVSGPLGSAALGLAHLQQRLTLPTDTLAICLNALHQPQPRVALGLALRGLATSCIDISDGLLADLSHVLKASKLGACLQFEQLPALDYLASQRHVPHVQAAMLAGGDDYELCFTAPRAHLDSIFGLAEVLSLPLTRIGETTSAPHLSVLYQQQPLPLSLLGYDHFA